MSFGAYLDENEFLEKCLPTWQNFLDAYTSVDKKVFSERTEVKNAFKIANSLENLLSANKAYSRVFAIKLEEKGGMLQDLSIDKCRKACDVLLTKLIVAQGNKTNYKEWAVDEYVAVCGKERLQGLIESILVTEMSCKVVLQYVKQKEKSDPSCKFASQLGLRIVAQELKELVRSGDVEGVLLVVETLLKDCDDAGRVLELLLLGDSVVDDGVKPVILETLLRCKEVEVPGSSSFWRAVVGTVEKDVVVRVCSDFPAFLEALLEVIAQGGVKLQCEYCQRTSSHSWVAPEGDAEALEFQQLVDLVRSLLTCEGAVAKRTLVSLQALRAGDGAAVWDEVLAAANV